MPFKPIKDRNYGTTADVVSRLFAAAGGVPKVMRVLGLSRTRVYALADPNDEAEISFERVAKLTLSTGATTAAEHLSKLAGGTYLPVSVNEEGVEWHQLTADTAQESAALLVMLVKSLGPSSETPGQVDHQEARKLLGAVDRLMRLLALHHRLLQGVIAAPKTKR